MISRVVQDGREYFDLKLASLNPGTLHGARWLIKANRILRLYVSPYFASVFRTDYKSSFYYTPNFAGGGNLGFIENIIPTVIMEQVI